jgi:hypothetical protein
VIDTTPAMTTIPESWASRIYDAANIALLIGLVVGLVATFLIVWMGNVKDEYLRKELSDQRERTANAELELLRERQHTANRDISPEDQAAISEKLKAFTGPRGQHGEIDIFPATFETRFLAGQIESILINAKWSMAPFPKLLPTAPIITVQGVGIFSTPDKPSVDAAKELFRLLSTTAASGVLIPPGSPNTSRGELPNPDNPRVVVLVGDKPTPLRSWVTSTPDSTTPKK